MSQIVETITSQWKDAMKSGDALRKETLSSLRAAIKKAEIDARTGIELDETARQVIIDKEAKKRRESIEEYTKANRIDLADKEKAELEIIAEFLPQQMNDDELLVIVRDSISEVGAASAKEMGKVMGVLVPKIAGRADGKKASNLVKELLSQ
ncbi:hypothetical protein B1R32_10794 [Abditibacterium utsteinense]|uniref:GatB/YqeY domain-containing protein n=1 Tax=Abditibacterium utsteinense TaxID=1960156 RepID=A0A2S8STJ8_9BACT|nr:GatB/YqeY domain-containing protein [Abditibacterium utsteinense]PQV64069.1 hypothetical protein B1R32_10794 [Abditibacterium utsteinense]